MAAPTAIPTPPARSTVATLTAKDGTATSPYNKALSYHATTQSPAVRVDPPAVSTKRPTGATTPAMAAVAGVATAGAVLAASRGSASSTTAKPAISTKGFSGDTAQRLAPQVGRFQERYREVQVVHQPTTSGWTWLFLAWALSNSSQNSKLEADNAAMTARMSDLERELRANPAEWQSLQTLASFDAVPSPQDGTTPAGSDVERDEDGEPILKVEKAAGNASEVHEVKATFGADGRAVNERLEEFVSAAFLPAGVLFVAALGFMFGIRPMLRS